MTKLRVLDLFSGIGGFSLGLERTGGFETVAFCEIDPDRRADLARMWPGVSQYDDVLTLNANEVENIDVITAGFPCQDISIAGRRAGINGERTGLFSEVIRLISQIRPRYAIMENSSELLIGERGNWAGYIFRELAKIGYDAEWHIIPASGLGAPHNRERIWIIATDASRWQQGCLLFLGRRGTCTEKIAAIIANNYRKRELQSGWSFIDQWGRIIYDPQWAWSETWIEKLHTICSMDDGVPNGMAIQTAKRFGNAVVPQIPELIGNAILASLREAA